MAQVKVSNLLGIEKCKMQGFMEGLNLANIKGKSYNIAVAIKNILNAFDYLHGNLSDLPSLIEEAIKKAGFISNGEMNAEVEILTKQLERYLMYERKLSRNLIMKNASGYVFMDAHEVYVSADAVFDNGKDIELVKYKKGEPSLSYRGQKFDTKPQNSIELYLMQKLGEKLYKDKPIVASYYYLKSKRDTKEKMETCFDDKDGDNIISMHFDTSPLAQFTDKELVNNIEKRIVDLLNAKLSFNSERTCKPSDCDSCQFQKICNYQETITQTLEKVEEKPSSSKSTSITPTDAQKQLINLDSGIYRVNAGAGAGKSFTLVQRTLKLISKGVKPKDILLITFTNKGCQELKERLKAHKDVKILTFNGLGEKVLNEEYKKLGFETRPILAEKVERYDIILKLLEMSEPIEGLDYKNPVMDLPYAKGCIVAVDNLFNKIKSKDYKTPEEFAKDANISIAQAEKVWELYQYFCEELINNGLVQYQDQINYALQIFKAFPDTLKDYAVKHIMIDEFQDTDYVQMEFIKILVKQGKFESLVVVGDDSQAIFGFREVTPDNIINFNRIFKSSKDINLVENFRSTPEILTTANLLNGLNQNKVNKMLISKRPSGKKPVLVRAKTAEEEYEWIVDKIEEKVRDGIAPQDIAVIARTKAELLEIEGYLKKRDIPVVIEATELLIHNKNVQMILSFANFFEKPETELSILEYLMMFHKDEILAMSSLEVKDFVFKNKTILLNEYAKLTNEEEKISFFFNTVQPIEAKDKNVEEFITHVKNKGFKTMNSLINYMKKFSLYKDELSVVKDNTRYKAVILTTAHSSKGKEFSVVFNTINKYRYTGKRVAEKDREEERRLLFVSITRAKDELFVTYSHNAKTAYFGFASELREVDTIQIA